MVINIVTFSLFWFVYRYNTLYVTKFRFDTGGLLFPKAVNQLFTGIYFMEICLIGLFFLVRDQHGGVACKGQAIVMIVVTILTAIYQILLNQAFGPLFRYLPITLEDDAVRRDEEFARVQGQRLGLIPAEEEGANIQDALEERERKEREADRKAEEIELQRIEAEKRERKLLHKSTHLLPTKISDNFPRTSSWADRSRNRRSSYFGSSNSSVPTLQRVRAKHANPDPEAQQAVPAKAIGQALFAGIHDELEDLTPDERDQLVQRAFQHEALRVKRPVIWIPRDDLGVSDDEIYRTQMLSKHIWISNEYQGLDGKCRCIFSRSPPDFSEVDLIQL
jgi:calcium permeable stress-gated cation channel